MKNRILWLAVICAASAFADEYVASFSATASISVPAATHGLGANPYISVRSCYSTTNRYVIPRAQFTPSTASNGDVTITLAAATTGSCALVSAATERRHDVLSPDTSPGGASAISFSESTPEIATFSFVFSSEWANFSSGTVNVASNWETTSSDFDVVNSVNVRRGIVAGARVKCGSSLASVLAGWTEPFTYDSGGAGIRLPSIAVTPVNCSAGDTAYVQLTRNGAAAGDISTLTATLTSAQVWYVAKRKAYE